MGTRDEDTPGKRQRAQTDESLRDERAKVDSGVARQLDEIEDHADQSLRDARKHADSKVQAARDASDLRGHPRSADQQQRERGQADDVLAKERSTADSALEQERRQRDRYLADFLAVERQATDHDLRGERTHADNALETRDDLLGIVSHDLRGMLSGLSLNAGLLAKRAPEGELGDAMRTHAGTSHRIIARMSRLVNDLADLASIEAGRLAVSPRQVELAPLLRDTVEAFEPIASAKGIALDADDKTAAAACIDPDRVMQVLANVVSNAIKFTGSGGRVSIRTYFEGGELRFAVCDTGIGIPPEALDTIFEKYHQVSPDRRGVGLGLFISRSIVEAHGGRMWAESEVGAGTTLQFTVPSPSPS